MRKSTWSFWKIPMDGRRIFLLKMRIGSTMYGKLFVEVTGKTAANYSRVFSLTPIAV